MAAVPNPNRNAWVQLYEARSVPAETETRAPGRPPGMIPRRKVGLTLSQGEISEIERWRERLSKLAGRKVSAGETVGILTRICSSRLSQLDEAKARQSLLDLVEELIGKE
jgi:hypothetical protein